MIKILKCDRIILRCFAVTLALFILVFGINCSAVDLLQGSVKVDSQVVKNRLFTVKLQAQCSKAVGVVMFTLEYEGDIEFRKCTVNDNSVGTVQFANNSGKLVAMYVNTCGIDISQTTALIDVTFKAGSSLSNAKFKVSTKYSASADEMELNDANGIEYTVEIVDKINNNSNATANEIGTGTEKTTNNKENKKENDKENNKPNSNSNAFDNKTEWENPSNLLSPTEELKDSFLIADSQNNSTMIFIAGGIFSLTVVVVVFIGYKFGKKSGADSKTINKKK